MSNLHETCTNPAYGNRSGRASDGKREVGKWDACHRWAKHANLAPGLPGFRPPPLVARLLGERSVAQTHGMATRSCLMRFPSGRGAGRDWRQMLFAGRYICTQRWASPPTLPLSQAAIP